MTKLPFALWLSCLTLWAQSAPAPQRASVGDTFAAGEQALRENHLDAAESAFRRVLAADPSMVGAHVNLGVVYMRRQQWDRALVELNAAGKLAPDVPGIRLNIGLVHFRRGDYAAGIPPLESVLRDQPTSDQARYLLGLCYFLTEDYAKALETLQPMAPGQQDNIQFLYVVAIAAGRTGQTELERSSLERLYAIGKDSPEVHILLGKSHFDRDEIDEAIAELDKAARGNVDLPLLEYYLGVAYRRKHDLERARQEFLAGVKAHPDVPFNYDQLGELALIANDNTGAEKWFRDALKRDQRLATSHYGLARVYRKEGRDKESLVELDRTLELDPKSGSVYLLRGQVLQELGRTQEAAHDFEVGKRLKESSPDQVERRATGQSTAEPALH